MQARSGEGDAPLDCFIRWNDALYQDVQRNDSAKVRDVRDSDTGQGMFDDGRCGKGRREC
jgi:hypothetical protein